jgi:hypothetical protein
MAIIVTNFIAHFEKENEFTFLRFREKMHRTEYGFKRN